MLLKLAKTEGTINNEKTCLLLYSGAEVSILDAAFARKVGCYIDESQRQECVGIKENMKVASGRTKIMVTLAESLVHFFDVLVGEMPGQDAILGMDFMVPGGTRLDLVDGTPCLRDEVHIQLTKRRPLHGEHLRSVEIERMISVDATQPLEVPLQPKPSETVDHARRTLDSIVVKGPGKRLYLKITNVSDRTMCPPAHAQLGMWLTGDRVPKRQGLVTVGSHRYAEWQNLIEGSSEILVDRPQYDPPKGNLKHPSSQLAVVIQITKLSNPEEAVITDDEPVETQIALADESGD
ncbi:hypothetical protein PC118_g3122 [Phytophthora cactorum]|uniref:Aspartic peptidase domain n=1 Tax=Phytophthora cactorum TaxID=29920 RepID=A0A8T1GPJ0_9STRA|nr:hypothetical protein PC118_g3122 [Phytophthora cactorum]